ncbi:MAG: 6,7-dimethyl-8-ribityllumazine synthase [Myxococcota bacterium]|nr:6,7-dimethyl-8-ribityllumazine synthase [Myxococcota bacterium]
MSQVIEGHLIGTGLKFALCATRWNHFIVDRLVEGARDGLIRHGVRTEDIVEFRTPGAFELPALVRRVAALNQFHGIVCLGAVIRGATPHFDVVAGEAASGVGALARELDIPVTMGVLTTDTIEQAIERAGTKAGNKGFEAAVAAIELHNLYKRISELAASK